MPKYKKFIADSRNEALKMIEREFGSKNVTIIREFPVKSPKAGFFLRSKDRYSIEVAKYNGSHPSPQSTKTNLLKVASSPNSSSEYLPRSVNRSKKLDQAKIIAMIENIQKVRNQNQQAKGKDLKLKRRTEEEVIKNMPYQGDRTDLREELSVNGVYDFLINRDFSHTFTKKVIEQYGDHFNNQSEDCRALASCIASFFDYSGPVTTQPNHLNLVYLVGPTGVGKTTTLAKIAASFFLNQEKIKIKIASFDIKRMMAMEQIAAFAKIIQVTFRKIFNLNHLEELLLESKRGELILLDTSGVSIKEKIDIDEIASFINLDLIKNKKKIPPIEQKTYLCLNASCRYFDLKRMIQSLKDTHFEQVIITKSDESYSLGSVLSVTDEFKLKIAYLTDGQDVPNDIKVVDSNLIEELLFKEWSS